MDVRALVNIHNLYHDRPNLHNTKAKQKLRDLVHPVKVKFDKQIYEIGEQQGTCGKHVQLHHLNC